MGPNSHWNKNKAYKRKLIKKSGIKEKVRSQQEEFNDKGEYIDKLQMEADTMHEIGLYGGAAQLIEVDWEWQPVRNLWDQILGDSL